MPDTSNDTNSSNFSNIEVKEDIDEEYVHEDDEKEDELFSPVNEDEGNSHTEFNTVVNNSCCRCSCKL